MTTDDPPEESSAWASARRRRAGAYGPTRSALLTAAAHVFARKGYAAASVGDIATQAQVSRPSFYAYFPTKRDAFLAVVAEVRDDFLAAHDLPARLDPESMGRAAIGAFLSAHVRYAELLTVIGHEADKDAEVGRMWQEMQHRPARRMSNYVADLAADGRAAPAAAPQFLADAMVALFRRFGGELAAGTEGADVAETAAFADTVEALTAVYLRLIGVTGDLQPDEH